MNPEMHKITARANLRSSYVGKKDFCAIFEQDMNTLYSLALFLTADHVSAEQAFLAAFNECLQCAHVFPGWERAWSRRAIVKQAIRMVRPRHGDSDVAIDECAAKAVPARLLELRPFDRFVFAMTVLERYTIRETAVFLNCVPSDVEKARVRVLQSLGPAEPIAATNGFLVSASQSIALPSNA
jgi:DNA-directed RNA polymerase specialized sigma24 family protein